MQGLGYGFVASGSHGLASVMASVRLSPGRWWEPCNLGEKKPVLGAGREGLGTHPPQGTEHLESRPYSWRVRLLSPQPTLPVELSLEPSSLVAALQVKGDLTHMI